MPTKAVKFNTDRSQILSNFTDRFSWQPHWEAEITLAVEGLESRIVEVERFAGSKAVISTLAKADSYRVEAQTEIDDLEIPILHERGIYPVEFEAIHGNEVVINAMARHLLFKDCLPRDKWPAHTEPLLGRRVRPYRRTVNNLSAVRRTGLWIETLESESARNTYWLRSILSAHSNPKTRDAVASQKQPEASSTAETP